MSSSSLISVIVPCYNSERYLRETLDSLRQQTHTNWECIIVDNGSKDRSKKIAEEYVKADPRFISIDQPVRGVSAARNKGIAHSKGKYILPLDSDDLIAPTYLEKAAMVLDSNPSIKVAYCEVEFIGAWTGKWELPSFSIRQMLFENIIFCTALYRRSDFDKTRGYNESMVTGYEDWDFWLSLLERDEDVYRIPEVLFYYRIRKESRNNSLDEKALRALRRQIYETHKELYLSKISISDLVYDFYVAEDTIRNFQRTREYILGARIYAYKGRIKNLFKKLLFMR